MTLRFSAQMNEKIVVMSRSHRVVKGSQAVDAVADEFI